MKGRHICGPGHRIRATEMHVPNGEFTGVCTVLMAGLWALLTVSGVGAAAQTDADAVRAMTRTRNQLDSLLNAYGSTLKMRFYRSSDNDPFQIEGIFDQNLRYSSQFELQFNVTPQNTIGVRVYPNWYDEHERINIDRVFDGNSLARQLLHFSASSFFAWGVDDASDVFARFTFTLESGFPDEAIKVVLRSIPLLDESVGEMGRFLAR
jgi:hypothetical protein